MAIIGSGTLCQLAFLIWASYNSFKGEFASGYLLLFTNFVLLVMYCMCIPGFIARSADISHLWGIFMLFTTLLPEAMCCFF